MVATQEEMNEARLPIEYRDYCAHILIPFNQCRRETSYMPWKCQDLRHLYEKCQFYESAPQRARARRAPLLTCSPRCARPSRRSYEVRRRELAKQAANA